MTTQKPYSPFDLCPKYMSGRTFFQIYHALKGHEPDRSDSMKGRWTSVQESRDSITSSLSLSQSLCFVITLDPSSEFARELDASVLPTVDGALVLGSLGVVRDGEVGYQLHPAVWGKGIAPEVLSEFILAYFDAFGDAEKLFAYTDSLNVRSTRVLEKSGFKALLSEPYESVELGTRVGCKWEVSRGDVKKWDLVETTSKAFETFESTE